MAVLGASAVAGCSLLTDFDGFADPRPSEGGTADATSTDGPALDGPASNDGAGRDAEDASATYTTSFATDETPLLESGAWIQGKKDGLDWGSVIASGGLAIGGEKNDDCVAHLKGFPANQFAEATVHRAADAPSTDAQQLILLLRFEITAHQARGYEILFTANGGCEIDRWTGAHGDFVRVPGECTAGALADGDVVRATAEGSTLRVFKNGALVLQGTDGAWADGNPGVGMFVGTALTPSSFAFADFRAGPL